MSIGSLHTANSTLEPASHKQLEDCCIVRHAIPSLIEGCPYHTSRSLGHHLSSSRDLRYMMRLSHLETATLWGITKTLITSPKHLWLDQTFRHLILFPLHSQHYSRICNLHLLTNTKNLCACIKRQKKTWLLCAKKNKGQFDRLSSLSSEQAALNGWQWLAWASCNITGSRCMVLQPSWQQLLHGAAA